jgi:xanthine dehydrogenase accessory factor
VSDGLRLLREATDGIVVTVAEAHGSSPRELGARMLVEAAGTRCSIGGGRLEHQAIAIARAMLEAGERGPRLRPFPLGPGLGQCCGGHVTLAFEAPAPLALGEDDAVLVSEPASGRRMLVGARLDGGLGDPALDRAAVAAARRIGPDAACLELHGRLLLLEPWRPRAFQVVLFGAGHVGRALVEVLGGLPDRVLWIDRRAEQFPDLLPPRTEALLTDPTAVDVPAGAHVLIMTHAHDLDLALLERLVGRDDLGSLGLIGSATKRRKFERRLRALGHDERVIGRLRCPIGMPAIRAKQPRAIAIAVAAELLALAGRSALAPTVERAREPV